MIKSPSGSFSSAAESPAPVRAKSVKQVDADMGKKQSYSVQTLKRILLLSSVTKQTTSTSDSSKTMLESCLQSESRVREVQAQVDTAILRVDRMRSRLNAKSESLANKKQESLDAGYRLRSQQSDTAELVNKLKATSTTMSSMRSTIEQEKNKLSASREALEKRRGRLIQELASWIYPVSLDSSVPTICGFMLPDIRQSHQSA